MTFWSDGGMICVTPYFWLLVGAGAMVLLLPAVTGGMFTLIQIWGHRALRYLEIDDYLNVLLYPFTGMAAGGLAGVGLSIAASTDGRSGLGWALGGTVVVIAAPFGAAFVQRSQAGMPERFSENDVARDIGHLDQCHFLSSAERQFFAKRAEECAEEGQRMRRSAADLTLREYWRTRSHRLRVLVWAWAAAGVILAASLVWLSGSWWPTVLFPAGLGLAAALTADWGMRRRNFIFSAVTLEEADADIRERLASLAPEPVLSLRDRLRVLLTGRRQPLLPEKLSSGLGDVEPSVAVRHAG